MQHGNDFLEYLFLICLVFSIIDYNYLASELTE